MIISPDDHLYQIDPVTKKLTYVWSPSRVKAAWQETFRLLTRAIRDPKFTKLVLLVGIPAAGKSTWLKSNQEPDAIYIDATFTQKWARAKPIQMAKEHGKKVEAVYLDVPLPVSLERNAQRPPDRRVPDDTIVNMAVNLAKEPPSMSEGFDKITKVQTKLGSSNPAELHVYDFDATLFRSPDLSARWKNWWLEERSLTLPCVPDVPGSDWWNGAVVADAKRSISDPNVYAILVTGRSDRVFRWRIPELLKDAGLKFDAVFLNPGGSVPAFKTDVVKRVLGRYRFIEHVKVWDDSTDNHTALRREVEGQGLAYTGVQPKIKAMTVDCDEDMATGPGPKIKPVYTAVFLDASSRKTLEHWWESNVGPLVGELIADHVTLEKKPSPESLAGMPIGAKFKFRVTGWADNGAVQAVSVESLPGLLVESGAPHVTVSTDGTPPSASIELIRSGVNRVNGPVLSGVLGWSDGNRPHYRTASRAAGENEPTDPGLWGKAVAEAKKRFKVYPSAYANGWASKWYKERGGKWRKKKSAATTKIDPNWVKGLRLWIKKTFVPKANYASLEDIVDHLKTLRRELNKLWEYLFYTKGLLPREKDDRLEGPINDLKDKVRDELKAADRILDDDLSKIGGVLRAMTPGTHEYKMDQNQGDWSILAFYQRINPKDPFEAARIGYLDQVRETLAKVEDVLSGKLLRAVTAFLTKYSGGLPFEPDEILLEYDIGKVKLVYDGKPDPYLIDPPKARHPRGLDEFIPYFKTAKALLDRKGFGKLWYGPIFVGCPSCGGENPWGKELGVAAHYLPWRDHIVVYYDPKPFMVELLIHELGHRYYYRFMSQGDRQRFDSFFGEVMAVSKYGSKATEEDFAEVFAHFVLGRDMTRDQIERFKAFLAKEDVGRSFTARVPSALLPAPKDHPDPKELAMGIEVELEHTNDREIAKRIALQHLAEDPRYYTHLKAMEAKYVKDASCRPYKLCFANRTAATLGEHKLPPLPYDYDALEPHVSEETLRNHHGKHHKAYVDGLNKAEKKIAEAQKDDDFDGVLGLQSMQAFNWGGHYLHSVYWKCLLPTKDYQEPSPELIAAVEADFGSWDTFRSQLKASVKSMQGSGWGVLVWGPMGMKIASVRNHENKVLWDSSVLLPMDAWEHAYYLDHQSDREAYFDAVFDHVVNWAYVERRLDEARKGVRIARGKAKKDVGHGGLDEWFSGHGGAKGKGEEATWGDWVAISPVKKTLDSGKKVKPGDIVGPCGISDDPDWKEITKGGKDPLKCMPRQKAHDMPKKERAEKAKEKLKAERKDSDRRKKPTMTPTFKKEDES
jgi:superoxide dismutase/predicted kinase